MRGKTGRRGFTLPEIIVVVAIIAVASSISLVAYTGFRKDGQIKSAAERVKALMTEARTRSIADDQPSAVTFDLNNDLIWIDDLDASLAIRKPKAIAPEYLGNDVTIEELKINGTVFTDDIRRVVFMPTGANPLAVVNIRRTVDASTVNENYYSVQMYPASAEPKVWANARK